MEHADIEKMCGDGRDWGSKTMTEEEDWAKTGLGKAWEGAIEEVVEAMAALDTQPGGTHYKDRAIQPMQYILANKLGYCEGNVVKYVSRHTYKNGREDIEKAIHYLQFILEDQYPVKV